MNATQDTFRRGGWFTVRGLGMLVLGALLLIAAPGYAQTTAAKTKPVEPYYDVAKEVTLKGTVSSVVTKPTEGMIAGSHLLLATTSGAVDVSLGRFGLQGKGALSVDPGEQIEVTGVMKTLREREVFVARNVKAGGQVYRIRNEHGIPVSPQARERGSQKTGFERGQQ
jgi:hypothetical protein